LRNFGVSISILFNSLSPTACWDEKEKCLAMGMDDYLSKPFRIEDLKVVIEKWGQGFVFE